MVHPIRLTYQTQLCRVRCELSREQALESSSEISDLMDRARAKLEAMLDRGDINFFRLYDDRLREVLAAFRRTPDELALEKVTVILGAGSKNWPGLDVGPPREDKWLATVSLGEFEASVYSWPFDWFYLNVLQKLEAMGVYEAPNYAQLQAMWLRRIKGKMPIVDVPLGGTHALVDASRAKTRSYSVVAYRQRGEVALIVRRPEVLQTKSRWGALLDVVEQAALQASPPGRPYNFLREDLETLGRTFADGPESLGLELPLVVLAAYGAPTGESPGTSAPSTASGGPGALAFDVAPDRMTAVIRNFDPSLYHHPSAKVDLRWIEGELLRAGILLPMADDVSRALQRAIDEKRSLNGLVACRGVPGVPGRQPFLYETFREGRGGALATDLDKEALDMRDRQQRQTVLSGQVVAEVRFGIPQELGRTVYGEEVSAPYLDPLTFKAGDGVELRDALFFYALKDGIPLIEGETVSLGPLLVHKGDVNLTSGNIRFDGPVEITGSIDQGAIVEVHGDLTIHGEIRGGVVWCRGNLGVKAGITLGDQGRLHCGGNLEADFLSNSRITVGGNLTVRKSILGCDIACGGSVEVLDGSGVVGGGQLIVRESLRLHHLGFKHGVKTQVIAGVDWRLERGIVLRKKRVERFEQAVKDSRLKLRELISKSQKQMTGRHQKLKEDLQKKIVRLQAILDQLRKKIAADEGHRSYSGGAEVRVKGILSTNVSMELCGEKIPIPSDLASVRVSTRLKRGQYIFDLNDDQSDGANGSSATEKLPA